MRTRWKVAGVGFFVVGAMGVLVLVFTSVNPLKARARKHWKEAAIADIELRVADTNWLRSEIRTVAGKSAHDETGEGAWVSDRLILLKNGEWLVFANKCAKEDSGIRDIFIAPGSDGQWRYSTYHFCIGMISLQIEQQPESLVAFSQAFSARPFDGRSDECLNKTWPPRR